MVIPKLVLPLRKALAVCSLGGVVFAEQHPPPPDTRAMTVDPDASTDVGPDEAATCSDAAFIMTGLEKNSEKKKMKEKNTREKKKANTNKNKKKKSGKVDDKDCASCLSECDDDKKVKQEDKEKEDCVVRCIEGEGACKVLWNACDLAVENCPEEENTDYTGCVASECESCKLSDLCRSRLR